MNDTTLQRIKVECEKIERETGFGEIVITFQDGEYHLIKPTPYIVNPKFDKKKKVCIK